MIGRMHVKKRSVGRWKTIVDHDIDPFAIAPKLEVKYSCKRAPYACTLFNNALDAHRHNFERKIDRVERREKRAARAARDLRPPRANSSRLARLERHRSGFRHRRSAEDRRQFAEEARTNESLLSVVTRRLARSLQNVRRAAAIRHAALVPCCRKDCDRLRETRDLRRGRARAGNDLVREQNPN